MARKSVTSALNIAQHFNIYNKIYFVFIYSTAAPVLDHHQEAYFDASIVLDNNLSSLSFSESKAGENCRRNIQA